VNVPRCGEEVLCIAAATMRAKPVSKAPKGVTRNDVTQTYIMKRSQVTVFQFTTRFILPLWINFVPLC
jgi:hypothetical protein